jgi:hypothetical protein
MRKFVDGAMQPGASEKISSTVYPQMPAKFLAPERLAIGPVSNAELGSRVEIPVRLSGVGIASGVTHVEVWQQDHLQREVAVGSGQAEIKQFSGKNYIEVVPQRLGKMKITVEVWFGDGGFATSSVAINVQPSTTPPLSFKADTLPALVLTLGASAEPIAKLHPTATYGAGIGKIPIPAEFLTYDLRPGNGPVPVSLSANGLVRALQPGQATIDVHFGSAVDRVPVIVQSAQY